MNICEANHAVSVEVRKFMENVGDVKEESITDYLVWRWREIDSRFNFARVTPWNHFDETHTTGADFDLELWLVGNTFQVSLAVQAKKFIKLYDSYVTRLRYPKGKKYQMTKLLNYAKTNNKWPFYFIYTLPQATTKSQCLGKTSLMSKLEDGAVFMADAIVMEEFADAKHGKRVSRDDLLKKSNPFHCLFCCPLADRPDLYFRTYFPRDSESTSERRTELPSYAQRLLNSSRDADRQSVVLESNEREQLRAFRNVGVYDMRNQE